MMESKTVPNLCKWTHTYMTWTFCTKSRTNMLEGTLNRRFRTTLRTKSMTIKNWIFGSGHLRTQVCLNQLRFDLRGYRGQASMTDQGCLVSSVRPSELDAGFVSLARAIRGTGKNIGLLCFSVRDDLFMESPHPAWWSRFWRHNERP